jgi:5-methylcytosine-specific restriction enzyme subunit McrC
MHSIHLRERTATECRLDLDDVAFLLAEHRAHLEVAPTRTPDCYRLTPAGHVGVIVAPNCRLVIRPKIPLRNLFHLLEPTARLPDVPDQTATTPGTAALDFLASQLAALLADRVRAGLHRGYVEQATQGRFLQGQLDVPAQLREPGGRKDVLHCRREDFTFDLPCNQTPKATAELLLRSGLLSACIQAALQQALHGFAEVATIELTADHFAGSDPLPAAYRPLFDLCRLLFESLRPGDCAGPVHSAGFLLDMERVFERYVTRGVQAAFARAQSVEVQPLFTVSEPQGVQPDLQMRPDMLVRAGDQPQQVIDAKWKVLSRSPLRTDDVYQVLAYCTALGVPQAVLVYPGKRDRVWRYPLTRSPVVVEIRTLRVVGSRSECRLSLRRLGRALAARSR